VVEKRSGSKTVLNLSRDIGFSVQLLLFQYSTEWKLVLETDRNRQYITFRAQAIRVSHVLLLKLYESFEGHE